jgi:hypothetical protein
MLVDPNTGLPMEADTPESLLGGAMSAQSASAGALSAVGQQAGFFGPGSIPDAALDAIPGLSQTTAWNMFRGSRTIAYGGKGVNQISGFRATMSPRYMFRMPSMGSLGGPSVDTANFAFRGSKYAPGQVYTPFNILARGGNYAFAKGASSSFVANRAAGGGSFASGMVNLNSEGKAFSMGALSRVTAADKMARGKLPTGNVLNFLDNTDKGLANSYRQTRVAGRGPLVYSPQTMQALSGVTATGDDATRLAYASVNGSISGRVSGFMAQMRLGTAGAAGQEAAEMAGKKSFVAGTQSAARFMERSGIERVAATATSKGYFQASTAMGPQVLEKFGVKAGEKVTMKTAGKVALQKGGLKIGARLAAAGAVNAVPIAGQIASAVLLADLAMDVGKLGVEVFKSGVDFAKEAAISYKGSINKGVMGMGYRDNTVAATSRSRGVQAIQNSRLNARSVLGSEAGAMHAHFG